MGQFGGLMGRFPRFAVVTFVLCLASIGLPGLNNFVSEMLMMAGLFDARNPGVNRLGLAVVAAAGIFLSAWYTLTMLKRVFFSPLKEPEPVSGALPADVSRREFFAFGSLAGLCLLLGLLPQPVLDTVAPDVRILSHVGDAARACAADVPFVSDEPPEPIDPTVKGMPAMGGMPGAKGKGGDPKAKGGDPKAKGANPKGKGGPKGPPAGAEE